MGANMTAAHGEVGDHGEVRHGDDVDSHSEVGDHGEDGHGDDVEPHGEVGDHNAAGNNKGGASWRWHASWGMAVACRMGGCAIIAAGACALGLANVAVLSAMSGGVALYAAGRKVQVKLESDPESQTPFEIGQMSGNCPFQCSK